MPDTIIREKDPNNSTAIFGIVAVIVVAALVALFVWRPWAPPSTTTNNSTTTITQPSAQPAATNNANSGPYTNPQHT